MEAVRMKRAVKNDHNTISCFYDKGTNDDAVSGQDVAMTTNTYRL